MMPSMKRSFITLKSLVLALMLTGMVRADDIPDICKPYLDTVDRCQKFDSLLIGNGWKESYRQSFDDDLSKMKDVSAELPENGQLPPQIMSQVLSKPKAEKGTVQLNAVTEGQALLKVGPPVTGEFAVHFKGKVISPMLCDLSLMLDSISGIGSFQFGGWVNTRNTLVTGINENGQPTKVDGVVPAGIVPNQWHNVRLEVTKNGVEGIVDGKVIVRGKLPKEYDWTKPRQPMIYIYASTAVIDEYVVERPADKPGEANREAAWKEAFVKKTPEQVQADLVALTKLLNDPEFAIRQGAHDLLARAGTLAEPALLEATKSGPLEGRDRAGSLLRALGVAVKPTE